MPGDVLSTGAIVLGAINAIVYPCRHEPTDHSSAGVRRLNSVGGAGASLAWRRGATIYPSVRKAQKNRPISVSMAAPLKKGLHLAVQTLIKFWCPGEDSNLHGVTR